MRIGHNIAALNTYRQYNNANAAQGKSMEKLSSGLRINKAGDDAAGLAISEKMRGQIRGLDMASKNAQDGISMISTAEGALNETHDILQRMRELSVQSSNATNTDEDRKALQNEVTQLKDEIDRIGNNTEFNTKKLLNGDLSGSQLSGKGSSLGSATAASIETGNFDPATTFTGGSTENFQVKLDGHTFDLSGVTSTDSFAFYSDLEDKLKTAIDAHNSQNPNDKVEYAKFETDVTNATTMNFKITSGTTGSKSEISISPLEDGTHTDAQATGEIQDLLTDSTTRTASSDGKLTAANATALTGLTTEKLTMDVNGAKIDINLATVNAATYSTDDDVQDVANDLKTDINNALSNYKDLTGTDFGTVDIKVKDGSFVISSSKADTVNIQFGVDDVSKKFGLAGTATSNSGGVDFHIGANKGQSVNLQINDMTTKGLNIGNLDISTLEGADNAIKSVDDAITSVSTERAKLGAVQNRLEHTINNLSTSSENLTAAESRVRDVDMAKEMMEQTKNSILSQAAQAMLAQSNQLSQGVLQLLR
ncbi:flagellin N-terminal helical domain-containing protein [Priestia megaterium]|uniref:flagellin N-terminal helical domain-containing protein n=1 Tax=Priestia megaterium TaxID=1404 RepID=UPI00390C516C